MSSESSKPNSITTHGDFSPGHVEGDFKVTLRGYRKPRTAPPFILPQRISTNFIGRLSQLEQLEQALLQSGNRKMAGIVGVAGTGGIGKSALACYFAEKHRDKFPDGVIGIRLDSKKDADTIAREFARKDGEVLDEDDTRNAAAIMQDLFAGKRILLIIDNAETADIRELHPGGQSCAIIVTTRDRALPSQIDIPSEQLIDLPVLDCAESIRLLGQFVEQGRIDEEIGAIHEILALIGNLPLAIEIVGKTLRHRFGRDANFKIASYAAALNLDSLQMRRDTHLNVRLCFQRSISYLEEDGRQDLVDAFAKLSVCADSGFALQTGIATMGIKDHFIAQENLYELVELSLLNNTQSNVSRFIFHPLLKQFAAEQAIQRSLADIAKNDHADYLICQVDSENSDTLENDLDDIVNAAEWMVVTNNENYVRYWLNLRGLFNRLGYWHRANRIVDAFLKLAEENENWSTMTQFYIQQAKFKLLQGELLESKRILNNAASIIPKIQTQLERQRSEAMRLNTLGVINQRLGNFDEAVEDLQGSYQLLRIVSDPWGQAKVLNSEGSVYQRQGKFEEAVEAFQKSYDLLVNLRDNRGQAMVLNSLGGVYQRQGKFEEAVTAFQKSAKIEEAINNQRGQAMVLNSLGGVYQRQGKFEEAVEAFQKSAKIEEAINNQRGQAMVLNSLGGVYQRQGKFEEAVTAFQKSYDLLVELADDRGQAMVLNSLGGVYQRQGKFEEAVEAFQKSAKIEEAINNQRGQAMVLNSLGGVYQRQGKFEEAVTAFQKSYDLLVELADDRGQAMVLNSLGGVYQRQGKFEEAVTAFQKSYDISIKLEDERSLAMVLNSLGGVYQRQGKFEEAVTAFQKSAIIGERIDDNRHLAMVLNSLGGVYQRQGKFEEAVTAFQKSYDISIKLEDERSLAMVLNSLGGVYQRQGKFEEAVTAFQKSAIIGERIDDNRHLAMVLNSLGGVYQRQGKFEEAVTAFQKSYDISIKLEDERSLAMVLNSLGGVYQRQGKFEEAVTAFQKSYDISIKLEDERSLAMVLNSLGGVYQRQGKFEEAVTAFQKSYDIGDKLRDRRHLAMVSTSWGRALLKKRQFDDAIPHLYEGFEIDKSLHNKRGIGIVAPILCSALRQSGKSAEAIDVCKQALDIAPQDRKLLILKDELGSKHLNSVSPEISIKHGKIKCVLEKDNGFRYGFIVPDDSGADIYFGENQVDRDLLLELAEGIEVTVEIEMTERGPRSRNVIRKT